MEILHSGNQATLHQLRKKYWILKGKQAVRKVIAKCVICHRYNAISLNQLMGDLPAPRVRITKPFTHTGCVLPDQFKFDYQKEEEREHIKDIFVSLYVWQPRPFT